MLIISKTEEKVIQLYSQIGCIPGIYAKLRLKLFDLTLLDRYIPKEGIILDLGCGLGVLSNYLALKYESLQVRGIDINEKRIKIAEQTIQNRKNIRFEVQDLRKIENYLCNGIIMTDFLHHLPFTFQYNVLEKCFQNLENKCIILIYEVDKNPHNYKYWFSYLSDILLYPFSEKLYFQSREEMKSLLSKIGYKVEVIPGDKFIFKRIIYICKKEIK